MDNKKVELFAKAMETRQRQEKYVEKAEGIGKAKDLILRQIRFVFEALDKQDAEQITTATVDLANLACRTSEHFGELNTYAEKIAEFGV